MAELDPCTACGTPLAGDQRYCLACGARHADARPLVRLATSPPSVAAAADAAAPRGVERVRRELTVLAGLGCLLLALGVGVLIGRAGHDTPARAAAPQVITVGAPATATTSGATPAASPSSSPAIAKAKAKGKAKAKASASKTTKATNKALKSLDSASPSDYQKKSQKLPKQVGTGGKPPKVDKSKPAGAGTSVQEIG